MRSIARWCSVVSVVAIAAVAVGAGAAAAARPDAPEPVAGKARNCAVFLTKGQSAASSTKCFESFQQMVEFGSGGVIKNAPATAGLAVRNPAFLSQVSAYGRATNGAGITAATVFIGLEFENAGYGGDALAYWGLNGPCSSSFSDIDYFVDVLPAGWTSRISSFMNFNVCWTKHYFWDHRGEPSTPYQDDQAVMPTVNGINFDNNTWSLSWT